MNPFLSVSRCFLLGPFLFFYSRKPHAKLVIERKRIDRTLLVLEDFCAFTMLHKFRYFFDASTACVILGTLSAPAFQIVRQFLRVSLRLDKPSEDRLVLTKVEKNILCWRARVRRLRYLGGTSMKSQEWRQQLGDCVRDLFLSPEMEHFYSIKMTLERARIYLLQLGIYVRQRRNFWPQVAANCPEFEVKQRIMEHEYEELVEDE